MNNKTYMVIESSNIYTFRVCDDAGKVFEYSNLDCDLVEHYVRIHEQLGYKEDKSKKKTYIFYGGDAREGLNSYKFSLCNHDGKIVHYDGLSSDQYEHLAFIHEAAGYQYSEDVSKIKGKLK